MLARVVHTGVRLVRRPEDPGSGLPDHGGVLVILLVPALSVAAQNHSASNELAELDAGDALPANEAVMEPVRVPQHPSQPPRVDDILEERQQQDVGPAHEDYPLVPGCEPVAGRTARLPLVDRAHHLGSRGVCYPAQWVDSFFAGKDADFHAARTLVRVIGTSQWQDDNTDRLSDVRVDARVVLPHTEDRLQLIFRSDDQEDDRLEQRERILEPDDGDGDTGVFRTALRYAVFSTRQATNRIDLGVRGTNPVVPFARTRFRYRQPLPWKLRARGNQEFYWRDNEQRRGMASELQLERPLTDQTLARLTASAESNTLLRDLNVGWRWNQSASWFWRIQRRSALQASLAVSGPTKPVMRADNRRFSVRFRRTVWRPWFYYEIEPFVQQQRATGFESVSGIAIRLETQLGDYE